MAGINIVQDLTVAKFGDALVEAFGRLKISSPFTIFDSQTQYDRNPHRWNELTGFNGTYNLLTNESSVELGVGTVNGDRAIRQSKWYTRYQPGKAQVAVMSGVFGARKTGVEKCICYGDDNNGVGFKQKADGIYIFLRKKTNGSVEETEVAQANWNGDKVNGLGTSGMNFNDTLANIFWVDLEWLGVGTVRVGTFYKGRPVICHVFNNENILDRVYMATANLPVRYEIANVAATASPTTMKQICATVYSEGGYEPIPYPFGVTASGLTIGTTPQPAMAWQLKNPFFGQVNRATCFPTKINILNSGNNIAIARLLHNPTITGSPIWSDPDDTGVNAMEYTTQYAAGSVTFTGHAHNAWEIDAGGNKGITASVDIKEAYPLSMNIEGTISSLYALQVWTLTGTTTLTISADWEEYY